MKKTTLLSTLLLIVSITIIVALNAANLNGVNFIYANNVTTCSYHVGNHYEAVDPTENCPGSKEYYICCNCHEIFFEEGVGNSWSDAGQPSEAFLQNLDPYDFRYIAPIVKWVSDSGDIEIEEDDLPIFSFDSTGDTAFYIDSTWLTNNRKSFNYAIMDFELLDDYDSTFSIWYKDAFRENNVYTGLTPSNVYYGSGGKLEMVVSLDNLSSSSSLIFRNGTGSIKMTSFKMVEQLDDIMKEEWKLFESNDYFASSLGIGAWGDPSKSDPTIRAGFISGNSVPIQKNYLNNLLSMGINYMSFEIDVDKYDGYSSPVSLCAYHSGGVRLNQFDVTFSGNHAFVTIDIEEVLSSFAGAAFIEWRIMNIDSNNVTVNDRYNSDYLVSGNIKFSFARYSSSIISPKTTANITFVDDGEITKETYSIGTTISLPSANGKEGYIFSHWSNYHNQYDEGDYYVVYSDHTFTANYVIENYSLDLINDNYDVIYDGDDTNSYNAAIELCDYLNSVLGKSITPIKDSNYSNYRTNKSKVISIGNNDITESISFFEINGSIYSYSNLMNMLDNDCFVLANYKYTYCLFGYNLRANQYATYEFIERYLDVHYLTREITYSSSLTEAVIEPIGEIIRPRFEIRQYLNKATYGTNKEGNAEYISHLRFNGDYTTYDGYSVDYGKWLLGYYKGSDDETIYIESAHRDINSGLVNLNNYPYDTYPSMWATYNDNPIDIHYIDGINSDGSINLSVSGNKGNNAASAMYLNVKAALDKFYNNNSYSTPCYVGIGMCDTNEMCSCDDCIAAYTLYNYSGVQIRFWNAIIDKLNEDNVLSNCNFKLVNLNYQASLVAPIIYSSSLSGYSFSSNRKISYDFTSYTIDESTVPDDKLAIRVAPLNYDRYLSINDSNRGKIQRLSGRIYDENIDYYKKSGTTYKNHLGHYNGNSVFSDWAKIKKDNDNLFTWLYDSHFGATGTYIGQLPVFDDNLDTLEELGYKFAFIQGNQVDNSFLDSYLNAYVFSKLCWSNNTKTAEQLRDEFLYYYLKEDEDDVVNSNLASAYQSAKNFYDGLDSLYSDKYDTSGIGNSCEKIVDVTTSGACTLNNITVGEIYSLHENNLASALNNSNNDTIKDRIRKIELTSEFMMACGDSAWQPYFYELFSLVGETNLSEGMTVETWYNTYNWNRS